ncbi:flagellar biosynthesis regulator FlaF [Hyphomonas sp.]|uniref:flagellar biosynthesis regulator FlaF n=1 Tax=Hyphomonas sp. TaxID=87 RepID=UPI0025B9F868|nr:flagellar biosynthesis regulator FlaF [Hyphomonas sp.]
MQALAYKAYGEISQRTAGDREVEYALFLQITEALESVKNPETRSLSDWADALSRNQQLWTIIATDLLQPGNSLPDDLKRSLLFLSEYVRQTSLKVLEGEESIPDLIEVNKTVMAGLVRQSAFSVEEEGV